MRVKTAGFWGKGKTCLLLGQVSRGGTGIEGNNRRARYRAGNTRYPCNRPVSGPKHSKFVKSTQIFYHHAVSLFHTSARITRQHNIRRALKGLLCKSFLIFSSFHLSHYCYKTPFSKFWVLIFRSYVISFFVLCPWRGYLPLDATLASQALYCFGWRCSRCTRFVRSDFQ